MLDLTTPYYFKQLKKYYHSTPLERFEAESERQRRLILRVLFIAVSLLSSVLIHLANSI